MEAHPGTIEAHLWRSALEDHYKASETFYTVVFDDLFGDLDANLQG
jgi:hypothetical protein